MAAPGPPEWLSTKEACDRLGVTLRTLYRLIDEHQIACHAFGRVYRIRASAVDDFLAAAQVRLVPRSAPRSILVVDAAGASARWCRLTADGGRGGGNDLDDLIEQITADILERRPVALGFCTPLSIPLPPTSHGIGRARYHDPGPAWSAEDGAQRALLGLQAAALVLSGVRERCAALVLHVGVDPERFAQLELDLLVWEAVSLVGGSVDVALAGRESARRLDEGTFSSDVIEPVCVSLIGAALAASGLSARVLGAPWVVATPARPRGCKPKVA